MVSAEAMLEKSNLAEQGTNRQTKQNATRKNTVKQKEKGKKWKKRKRNKQKEKRKRKKQTGPARASRSSTKTRAATDVPTGFLLGFPVKQQEPRPPNR